MIRTLFKNMVQIANLIELIAIIITLLFAFTFQFFLQELPCPLCLLQRVGFLFMAYGFLMNFQFGFRPSHYSVVLISGLFTSFVALRQIALHVIPGTGAYGSAMFGLHLYTWSFIGAIVIVIVTALLLGIDRQYQMTFYKNISGRILTTLLFIAVTVLIIANIISVIMECGFKTCPDNPMRYELIDQSIRL